MKLSDYIQTIKSHPEFRDVFVYHRHLPPRKPVYGPRLSFNSNIHKIIKQLGFKRLYSHQVEAIEHLRQGADVLVATPTASGKSLIYNLIVLEKILNDKSE